MDEQQSAKESYERFLQRLSQLNDDFQKMILQISELRERIFQLCDIVQNSHVDEKQQTIIDRTKEDTNMNSNSSFHSDYQLIQLSIEVSTDKIDQQLLKGLGKELWKVYLKFSLLNGERVHQLLMKAKALSYPKLESLSKTKEFIAKYFQEQTTQEDGNNNNNIDNKQKENTNHNNSEDKNNNSNVIPTMSSTQQIS